MIGKEAKEKGYVSIGEVFDILKGRKAGELKYEQQLVLEYAEKFKTDKKAYNKVKNALESIEISDSIKAKILEIMPKSDMLLKQILASERASMSGEDMQNLLKTINEA